ncbi:SDR family oxidoreductase [Endozoicomonas sp. SM1973]|uniref:SDR family oxidoreductase n=1 Tax=Spartinivicinus marinus TaxID=2994442 RepID=A0A853ICD5_9GAMM|nr:SDR family oxidoreductase [Spartinivicinus marinus]MCX4027537.1 SDR family oxidoreductase [Spartinivicinus marinus]NYZ68218.1 SDR family oxidoreductase [Spartinivicinus marinus]
MEKVIIITGASRGIGAASALLAAKQNYAVCVNYQNDKAAAEKVVSTIQAAGSKAVAVAADVSKEADVKRLFAVTESELGPITGLVNNAGVLDQQTKFENMSVERWQRIFNINVIGSMLCAREAILRMSTQHGGQGGAIVNVSSTASFIGGPNEYVDYAASKGAIDSLTIGLAKEVAAEGIRVNAVRPGMIYTDIHASGGEPGRVDRLKEAIPMKRGGTAEEVANAIMWLLSEEASYCSGSFIELAGARR